ARCRSGRGPFDLVVRGPRGARRTEEHTMSKYMLIWRPTDEALAAMSEIPFEEMLEKVGRFNDELIRAGVLLAAEGLEVPSEGVVLGFAGVTRVVTDGPYGETKELFTGYYIIGVASKEEAIEWAK